jgi:hypothetical protein
MRMVKATVLLAAALAAAGLQEVPGGFNGKLYRSAFFSGAGTLTHDDLAPVAEPLKARLARFLERRTAFKSRYKSAPDTMEKMRADAKRREIERAIVAIVEAPGIEKIAADFVAAAPVAYEWEGMHDGPLDEARFAESTLKGNPGSPLAPWLALFIAQRQRVAFEAYENEKNTEGMRAAAAGYRTFIERARAAGDPIYAAIAGDMESQPHLYIKNSRHPRDYSPGL